MTLSYEKKALFASAIGYAMDGFDLLILSFLLPAISLSLALTAPQAGSLLTFTLIGAVLGGALFGVLSDYFGRIKILTLTILIFAFFTGLCSCAQGYWDLLIYRTLAGFGLGGEFGIGMALAAEVVSPKVRAAASSFVALGWQAGVFFAAILTPLLLPLIGWRGCFAIGVFPAVVAFLLRKQLIDLHRKPNPLSPFPIKLMIKDWKTTKLSFGVFCLCSIQTFGYYSLMIWLPTYLSKQFGYTLTKSSLWTAISVLGMAVGIWCFGKLADRFGRKPIFILYQAGAALSVILYSQLTAPLILLVGGALMGFFVNGMLGGYGALISEIYPREARATAQNILFNLGRAVGGFGPLVIGLLVTKYSFSLTIALLAIIYVVDIFVTLFLIPEKKGEPLTSIHD